MPNTALETRGLRVSTWGNRQAPECAPRRIQTVAPLARFYYAMPMKPIYLFQSLICAAVISFIDSRNHEAQVMALLILTTTFIFGTLHAQRAWAYAFVIGLSIFATQVITRLIGWPPPVGPQSASALSSLIALLPAFIGAYSGAGLRWVLDGLSESQKGQKKAS